MATTYLQQLLQTRAELLELATTVRQGRNLTQLTVSAEADAITGFRRTYQARLTARRILNTPAEFKDGLLGGIQSWLHNVTSLIDYATARNLSERSQIDVEAAVTQYNVRARALERFLDYIRGARTPDKPTEKVQRTDRRIVEQFSDESERQIFQVVSRTVPVDQGLDEEISTCLAVLIRWCHGEPTIERLVDDSNELIVYPHEANYRVFAASQELRDYVAPYLVSLFRAALSDEGVQAYDDAFRNVYFAVVNRVIHYYQEHPKQEPMQTQRIGEKPIPNTQAIQVVSATNQKPPNAPSVPLITEDEIENVDALTDGQSVDVDADAPDRGKGSVTGTGLE